MQNKGPKKGKIGPQKALINKTRLGFLGGLFFLFWGPYFAFFANIYKTKIKFSPKSGARGGLAWCDTRCDTASPSRAPEFGEISILFCKITQKMQNKGPKKGKIGFPKSPAKTRLGSARRAPPNLVLLMRAF